MKILHRLLLRFKNYKKFIDWTKRTHTPLFRSQTIFDLIVFLIQELQKQRLHNNASALSYSFLFAIFPAIIFLFTLLPYVPVDNFQVELMSVLELILPKNAFLAVENTLVDVISTQRGGLLSVGFVSALLFATNGIHSLMNAFNQSAFYQENRSWFRQRWVAIKLTIVVTLSLIMAISTMLFGNYLMHRIEVDFGLNKYLSIWSLVIYYLRWLLFLFFYLVTIALLYRYAPSIPNRWPIVTVGAFTATSLAAITSIGFSTYINYFDTYNKIYGSIGTLIVVMLWLYLNSLIILIGFELNARYFLGRSKKGMGRYSIQNFANTNSNLHEKLK